MFYLTDNRSKGMKLFPLSQIEPTHVQFIIAIKKENYKKNI